MLERLGIYGKRIIVAADALLVAYQLYNFQKKGGGVAESSN